MRRLVAEPLGEIVTRALAPRAHDPPTINVRCVKRNVLLFQMIDCRIVGPYLAFRILRDLVRPGLGEDALDTSETL